VQDPAAVNCLLSTLLFRLNAKIQNGQSWRTARPLAVARPGPSVALLPDGRISFAARQGSNGLAKISRGAGCASRLKQTALDG
jgi:hypothetical protein